MKTPESLLEILNHHLNGGKFEYKSYDHKGAESDYKSTDDYKSNLSCMTYYDKNLKDYKVGKHELPIELREKYSLWRNGKLRKVEFNNDGSIQRVYIGNKYAIPVYESSLSNIRLL